MQAPVLKNGKLMTDSVAWWVKKKYVLGPFDTPPFDTLNISPLMAATQKNKVRPILNLSAPEGTSFNDALNEKRIAKITMNSSKKFSQSLRQAGKNALFSKQDIIDAYKLIPCAPSQWKFFGFKWLGKFFIDRTTPFGSKAAPANFDCLAETIANLALTISNSKRTGLHRQLDDFAYVSHENSQDTNNFYSSLKYICKKINIPLAENCKKFEKAFGPTKKGTVLGIEFDSSNLTWKMPSEKTNDILIMLEKILSKKECNLLEFQKLHGKLNDFTQLNIFLKGFKFHQNNFLASLNDKVSAKTIPKEVKKELKIWSKCIIDTANGLPIPLVVDLPPTQAITFISDAAGGDFTLSKSKRGAASLGYDNDNIFFVSRIWWPVKFLKKFGNNSTLLEIIGIILPFLCCPETLINKNISLEVDNSALVFGWMKKRLKYEECTSIFIQTLHLLEAALSCRIFIQHVPRRSTKLAKLADNLSREKSSSEETLREIDHLHIRSPKGNLKNWLENAIANWDLPRILCDEVTNHLNNLGIEPA